MALNTDEATLRKSAKSSNLKTFYKSLNRTRISTLKNNWVQNKYSWLPTTRLIAVKSIFIEKVIILCWITWLLNHNFLFLGNHRQEVRATGWDKMYGLEWNIHVVTGAFKNIHCNGWSEEGAKKKHDVILVMNFKW
jgi:hypothetical protein